MATNHVNNDIPCISYNEKDFVYSGPTWSQFRNNKQLSKFDELLGSRWEEAMRQGAFNYTLWEDEKKCRVVPGKEGYILALSLKRGVNRRQPEYIDNINKPYDPSRFNFNKVKAGEIIMKLQPDREQSNREQSDNSQEEQGHHQIIINVSPFEYGHVLFTPDVNLGLPQRISLKGLRLTLEMMLLSAHPGFRVGFNGLCALASVNHQHVHGWCLDTPLRLEVAPVKHLKGPCYELVDMPTRAFMFQLHGNTVLQLAQAVFAVTDYFQNADVAHNMFITRGVVFGESDHSENTTVRVAVWPRKHYIGDKSKTMAMGAVTGVFNVAVAELAGHVPMYYPNRFDDLTEPEIVARIQDSLLQDDRFNEIRDVVCGLMEASLQAQPSDS